MKKQGLITITDRHLPKFDQITDPDFWLDLCARMSITSDRSLATGESDLKKSAEWMRPNAVRVEDWENCKSSIHNDGYFAYESFFSKEAIELLAGCLRTLDEHHIPPVFCFVYDDFWTLALGLRPLLSDLLGDYLLLPAVWTWIVKMDDQCAFAPHRDFVRETAVGSENHLDYVTVWIPLTNLDHRSSSISVLPASADPDYASNTPKIDASNLQVIRSLQVPRGSVLAWTVQLAHWGTMQQEHSEPRMSVAYYVQKSHAECFESPPIDLTVPFTFRQRLRMIGNQIQMYDRNPSNELIRLASDLCDITDE